MTGYKTINDPEFERPVTLRDAYKIMERFVTDFEARGDVPVIDFITYFGLLPDGRSSDPAAIYDFLEAAEKISGDRKV